MATVWRASSRGAAGFERTVALKRILPKMTENEDFVAMFIEEARVGSQLQHPHVVQINDFGRDERGGYFLVMEWVEGLDLRSYLKAFHQDGQQAPWPLVVAICIEALRGLAAAHERTEGAVIHRDINPQNVLVGVNGIAKLTDFGLSRAMDRARMTQPDIVKGKVGYLAPEITQGKNPSVQTDIFGAGIMLWEVLAGRRLFDADNDVATMLQVRECAVPSLQSVRGDLPEPLCAAAHAALAKDPADRFSSAYAMGRALAAVLRATSEPTDARAIAQSVRHAKKRLIGQA